MRFEDQIVLQNDFKVFPDLYPKHKEAVCFTSIATLNPV